MSPKEDVEAVAEERRRLRMLRTIVDLTTAVLMQGRLTRNEAESLVSATKSRALEMFPDKEGTYDLILAPRFARLMNEFVGGGSARVLPFSRRL